jgi:GNAT superfamily N-acetyltransferase
VEAELELALELDRRLYVRAAQEVTDLPEGWAYRHDDLPQVYMLNGVRLRAPLPPRVGTADLVEIADRALAGLRHRQIVVTDAPAGERLSAELEQRGWERQRTEFMALRGDPDAAPPDLRARELTEDELRGMQLDDLSQPEYGRIPGLPERLVAGLATVRAATTARGFGAGEHDELLSSCTLFLDPDVDGRRVAMVESVGTLREHRQRGLAKAVVSAAIRAAGEWDADLIVVPADADDWPQLLYAGLGFVPIGRQITFTLRPGSG